MLNSLNAVIISWDLSRSILFKVRSLVRELRSFSISLRNLASLTGKPPSSDIMLPGSSPTLSTNTRPKRSRVSLYRPSKASYGTPRPKKHVLYLLFSYKIFLRLPIEILRLHKCLPILLSPCCNWVNLRRNCLCLVLNNDFFYIPILLFCIFKYLFL